MSDVSTVGVVGAGQMGAGIAQVAAVSGREVLLYDAHAGALDKAKAGHEKRLLRDVEKGKLSEGDKASALSRISYQNSLDGLSGAGFVVEAIVEDFGVKRDVFAKLAGMFKDGQILASNTSSISITRIARAVEDAGGDPSRVIGMHFFNPVPIMKLVEVISAIQTSEQTTGATIALAEALGKTALPANDRPGFVSNRVLMPMINEAFYAWMEGVAEPGDIDGIMKLGCNFPMGPLNLADFIGLDTCVHIMDVLADGLNNDRYRACPLLKQLVTAGRLGVKTGRGVFEYGEK